jgi:hypothetical protein
VFSEQKPSYTYTPLMDTFSPPRSHSTMPFAPMAMTNGAPFQSYEAPGPTGFGQDPVNMRSVSAPIQNMVPPGVENNLLRHDWKSGCVVGDSLEEQSSGGKAGRRSWPCIFKDCRKVYTTGAGLRYHLHNFHNSPSPRFINRPSVLFPCLKCKKSYVTKAGLRYHKAKTGHGKRNMSVKGMDQGSMVYGDAVEEVVMLGEELLVYEEGEIPLVPYA